MLAYIKKLQNIRTYLESSYLERTDEIDGIILAIMANSTAFFYGPPGTAKSALIDDASRLLGLEHFDILLSETTKPESIFGPIDVPALAKGSQYTKTKGYAPEANTVFFDEIFKAGPTVLNGLLKLINEKTYRNGDKGVMHCPIISTFAASNEIPKDDTFAAIYDRLILRFQTNPIGSRLNMRTMLLSNNNLDEPDPITLDELETIQGMIDQVSISNELVDTMLMIRDKILQNLKPISISDRRVKAALKIVKARALLDMRMEVEPADLFVLSDIFWEQPDQIQKIKTIVLAYSNAEIGDIFSFEELADSVFQNGLKSGSMAKALEKLEDFHKQVSEYTTSSGRKIANKITGLMDQAKDHISAQKELTIVAIKFPNSLLFKVAHNATNLFSKEDFRKLGFRLSRKNKIWQTHGDPNDIEGSIETIKDRILTRLAVEAKFKILNGSAEEQESEVEDEAPSDSSED